jgi:hypothetical protein
MAELRTRKRLNINAPKRRDRSPKDVNKGCSHTFRMRDGDHAPRFPTHVEPFSNSSHDGGDRFAAVRSGARLPDPCRERIGFFRLYLFERAAGPTAVIAAAKRGFNGRVEPEKAGSLPGTQRRAGIRNSSRPKSNGCAAGLLFADLIERCVGRENHGMRGLRRCAAD